MSLLEVLEFTLIPCGALLLGSFLSQLRRPSVRFDSAVQHFAAGVVFAAVAAELLPQIKASGRPGIVAAGFLLGVAFVLALKVWSEGVESRDMGSAVPYGLLVAVGVDILLDGALVGLGFVAGAKQGVLLTLALTLELLSLGLSTASSLAARGLSSGTSFGIMALMAVAVPLGAVLGAGALAHASGALFIAVLSFGAAALLYLVTEELLAEAHQEGCSPWLVSSFFLGFLVVLLLEMGG